MERSYQYQFSRIRSRPDYGYGGEGQDDKLDKQFQMMMDFFGQP